MAKFEKGNSFGKGRPKGSRNKITKRYLDKLAKDFKKNGQQVLDLVRETDPSTYLRLVASLVPKQYEAEINHVISAEELSDGELADIATAGSTGTSKTQGSKKESTSVH